MFRLLRFFFLLLIIAAIVAGVYLWMARVPTLERFLSKRLNTKVTIEEVHLGWGLLSIEGLRIKNPPQAAFPYAFQSGSITIEMNPFELWRETIHIDRIKMHNPAIGIELFNNAGTDNNWARLLNDLPSGGERKFVVKKLTITNLRFDITRFNGKEISVPPIPFLEFENLGEKGALTFPQLGRVIFQSILQSLSSKAYLNGLLENVSELPQNLLDGVTSTLPLEETRGTLEEGVETIRRKTKEAKEFLQDLFTFGRKEN